jgi:hypothetical protein
MRHATRHSSARPSPPLSKVVMRCHAAGEAENQAADAAAMPIAKRATCRRRPRKSATAVTTVAPAATRPPRDAVSANPATITPTATARSSRPPAPRTIESSPHTMAIAGTSAAAR